MPEDATGRACLFQSYGRRDTLTLASRLHDDLEDTAFTAECRDTVDYVRVRSKRKATQPDPP